MGPVSDACWSEAAGGIRLHVRLTPRGGRDRIDGIVESEAGRVLQLRVSAPPVDGAANAALIRLLARELGLRKSAITIEAGEKSRLKTLHLAGDAAGLAAQLDRFR